MPGRNLVLRSLGPAIEHLKPHLSAEFFTAGQLLKRGGAPTDRIYFPTSGLISSRIVLERGDELECALIGSTNGLGLLTAVGLPAEWARYVCLTDGHAWTIGAAQLASVARGHPTVERQLTRFCFVQMGYTAHLGVCNAMHSAEQRLARWLGTAAGLLRRTDIAITQNELASILGLQRTAVNPALHRLQGSGAIEVTRGRVRILDPERLSRRACECLTSLMHVLCAGHQFLEDDAWAEPA